MYFLHFCDNGGELWCDHDIVAGWNISQTCLSNWGTHQLLSIVCLLLEFNKQLNLPNIVVVGKWLLRRSQQTTSGVPPPHQVTMLRTHTHTNTHTHTHTHLTRCTVRSKVFKFHAACGTRGIMRTTYEGRLEKKRFLSDFVFFPDRNRIFEDVPRGRTQGLHVNLFHVLFCATTCDQRQVSFVRTFSFAKSALKSLLSGHNRQETSPSKHCKRVNPTVQGPRTLFPLFRFFRGPRQQ